MPRKKTFFSKTGRLRHLGATKRYGRMGASKGKPIGGPGFKIGRKSGKYRKR